MAPEFERAAGRLEPKVRLLKVNIDAEPVLGQRFSIQSIPTVMLAHRGRELARQAGALSAAQLESWVMAELERFGGGFAEAGSAAHGHAG